MHKISYLQYKGKLLALYVVIYTNALKLTYLLSSLSVKLKVVAETGVESCINDE